MLYEKFKNILHRSLNSFCKAVSILRNHGDGRLNKRKKKVQQAAQETMDEKPTTSIGHLSQQLGVSTET